VIADGALPHAAFLGFYLVLLIGVGAWKARGVRTQEDFSLAGRGLSTVVLVGTLLATWIGTGSIFGNAEQAYEVGVATFLLPLSSAVAIVALAFLAPRIRRFGQFTIQDILEARFGPAARVLGTLTLLGAYVIIVSYQYRAGASVLDHMLPGVGHRTSVCLVAFFVVLYTALAGMVSVAYTDVANGVLMLLGLALALPLLLSEVGGLDAAREALAGVDPSRVELLGTYSGARMLSVLLPAFLLLLGDANVVQRFFSARDPKSARRAAVWMFFGVLVLDWLILGVALLGRALVAQGAIDAPEAPARIVVHLAFEALPPALGALLVGTVVAVVVSTADSYLLSPATSLVRDVIQRFVAPGLGERDIVRVGRIVVVVLGLVALGLAFTSDRFFSVALFAYTIYGAGITPALLAAYFWRRATAAGAVASMLTGVGCALGWKLLTGAGAQARLDAAGLAWLSDLGRWGVAREVDAVLPAVAVSVVVLVVVSLATPPPDPARAGAF
jgi:SSS family solute:Na+ symporter/sodium/proline symporter